jgi:hypothetical protein
MRRSTRTPAHDQALELTAKRAAPSSRRRSVLDNRSYRARRSTRRGPLAGREPPRLVHPNWRTVRDVKRTALSTDDCPSFITNEMHSHPGERIHYVLILTDTLSQKEVFVGTAGSVTQRQNTFGFPFYAHQYRRQRRKKAGEVARRTGRRANGGRQRRTCGRGFGS